MNSKLAIGLAMFIAGIATQLGSLPSWLDFFTPGFIGGMLIQLSGFILSVWGGIEAKPPRSINARDRYLDKLDRRKDENNEQE